MFFHKVGNNWIIELKYNYKFQDLLDYNYDIYKELLENEVIVDNINYQKIPTYNYLKLTDCFNANPLYVKTIEALNDKKNAS